MQKRLDKMAAKRKSDAGFSTMELVIYMVIVAILASVGVGLFFTLSGNANESNAQAAGSALHEAVFSYYGDYGNPPADAAELNAYLAANGDDALGAGAPDGTTLVWCADPEAGAPSSAIVVEVWGTEFSDVIQIDRTGTVTKSAVGESMAIDLYGASCPGRVTTV